MEKFINLLIASPTQVHFSGKAVAVTVPSTEGEMQILPEHEPIIAKLRNGTIKIKLNTQDSGEEIKTVDIKGGVLENSNNSTTVLVTQD